MMEATEENRLKKIINYIEKRLVVLFTFLNLFTLIATIGCGYIMIIYNQKLINKETIMFVISGNVAMFIAYLIYLYKVFRLKKLYEFKIAKLNKRITENN